MALNPDPAPADPATPPHSTVYIRRALDPAPVEIPPEVKAKHDESARLYPELNLSDSEYIINAVRRHWIGLFWPVSVAVLLYGIVLSLLVNYDLMMISLGVIDPPAFGGVLLIAVLFLALIGIGCYIVIWVYTRNTFFLTNESVIQEIQTSLFSRLEQTVSLANIEDASFTQKGLMQSMFDYGSIRLSTEGDETTYRFDYVTNPKQEIAQLNNAVEAFKNGRPVVD